MSNYWKSFCSFVRNCWKHREYYWILFGHLLSLIGYLLGVVITSYSVRDDFENARIDSGIITIINWLITGVVTTYISTSVQANQNIERMSLNSTWLGKMKSLGKFLVISIFHLASPLSHRQAFVYAGKALRMPQSEDTGNEYRDYHNEMLRENRHAASLDMVMCCIKTGPQFILQMSLEIKNPTTSIARIVWARGVGWCLTIILTGCSMKSYRSTSRSVQPDKAKMDFICGYFVVVWHSGSMGSRFVLTSIAVSMWHLWAILGCFLFWVGWFVYLYFREDAARAFGIEKPGSRQKIFFSILMGIVYMFAFVNLKNGRTCLMQWIYFGLNLLVNGICACLIHFLWPESMKDNLSVIASLRLAGKLYIFSIIAQFGYCVCSSYLPGKFQTGSHDDTELGSPNGSRTLIQQTHRSVSRPYWPASGLKPRAKTFPPLRRRSKYATRTRSHTFVDQSESTPSAVREYREYSTPAKSIKIIVSEVHNTDEGK